MIFRANTPRPDSDNSWVVQIVRKFLVIDAYTGSSAPKTVSGVNILLSRRSWLELYSQYHIILMSWVDIMLSRSGTTFITVSCAACVIVTAWQRLAVLSLITHQGAVVMIVITPYLANEEIKPLCALPSLYPPQPRAAVSMDNESSLSWLQTAL